MRAIFISQPARAYGEINVALPLAEEIIARGGEAWFLASPLAAGIVRSKFPDRSFELGSNRADNQVLFWRMVKKFSPDLIIFTALHELLRPNRILECPLIDRYWLYDIVDLETAFVFIDFIAHVPGLRETAECLECSSWFGPARLRAFLRRLWIILPCPLNEPAFIEGRCGIPFLASTRTIADHKEEAFRSRARVRQNFGITDEALVLRGGSNWQSIIAEEYNVPLYEYLGRILEHYLGELPRPVTLVSVSDRHEIQASGGTNFRVINLRNLTATDYNSLISACDLLLTDNEIGYSLAQALGRVPGVVLVNSFTFDELIYSDTTGSVLRNILIEIEQRQCGAIYPFCVFPLRAEPAEIGHLGQGSSRSFVPETVRLGRMPSSPYYRLEIFGGTRTRAAFQWLLTDESSRTHLQRLESAYLERLKELNDGSTILARILDHSRFQAHRAL
jgi:hypothetical protein